MTITIHRNVLLFAITLVALAAIGYVVGTYVAAPSPPSQTTGPVVITATLPPGAAEQVSVPTQPPDTAPRITMEDFKKEYDAKADMLIVDVRTPDAYAAGHIAGAVNIPEAEGLSRLAELPKDKHIVLYCA